MLGLDSRLGSPKLSLCPQPSLHCAGVTPKAEGMLEGAGLRDAL